MDAGPLAGGAPAVAAAAVESVGSGEHVGGGEQVDADAVTLVSVEHNTPAWWGSPPPACFDIAQDTRTQQQSSQAFEGSDNVRAFDSRCIADRGGGNMDASELRLR